MSAARHVALLIETSRAYGRGCLQGVKRYLLERGAWSLFVERRSLESPVPPWLNTWRGDGVLTRTDSPELLDAILRSGAPAVELRPTLNMGNPFPVVRTNDRGVGELAARYLLAQEHYQFACVSVQSNKFDHLDLRRDGFIDFLRARGRGCELHYVSESEEPFNWEKQQDGLAAWLARLPKPVGLLATTDQTGLWLLDACARSQVRVPDDVAVVGVENDVPLCAISSPPLSSVRLNTPEIGFLAAQLLDRLMRGERVSQAAILVDPIEVVVRRSSDALVMGDKPVAQALQIIRQRGYGALTVDDVAQEVRMSRSTLERRMRRAIGRSPMSEIRRVRLDRARQLLVETDLSLADIAARSGFQHPQYLNDVFKQSFGETPGSFRRASRRRHHSSSTAGFEEF